jgi:hypothetical protein
LQRKPDAAWEIHHGGPAPRADRLESPLASHDALLQLPTRIDWLAPSLAGSASGSGESPDAAAIAESAAYRPLPQENTALPMAML